MIGHHRNACSCRRHPRGGRMDSADLAAARPRSHQSVGRQAGAAARGRGDSRHDNWGPMSWPPPQLRQESLRARSGVDGLDGGRSGQGRPGDRARLATTHNAIFVTSAWQHTRFTMSENLRTPGAEDGAGFRAVMRKGG